ncbi:hypothetical protein P5673_000108 [Acropora cervicornis]|uniref:Uncharacterized protein n=1 Tax=Acropora cervicornis TaxID=6130 RepID=A0AAD9VGV9_ACRCE|nr:hypothetical protein P5673_000108 [Acropora cervicornis]
MALTRAVSLTVQSNNATAWVQNANSWLMSSVHMLKFEQHLYIKDGYRMEFYKLAKTWKLNKAFHEAKKLFDLERKTGISTEKQRNQKEQERFVIDLKNRSDFAIFLLLFFLYSVDMDVDFILSFNSLSKRFALSAFVVFVTSSTSCFLFSKASSSFLDSSEYRFSMALSSSRRSFAWSLFTSSAASLRDFSASKQCFSSSAIFLFRSSTTLSKFVIATLDFFISCFRESSSLPFSSISFFHFNSLSTPILSNETIEAACASTLASSSFFCSSTLLVSSSALFKRFSSSRDLFTAIMKAFFSSSSLLHTSCKSAFSCSFKLSSSCDNIATLVFSRSSSSSLLSLLSELRKIFPILLSFPVILSVCLPEYPCVNSRIVEPLSSCHFHPLCFESLVGAALFRFCYLPKRRLVFLPKKTQPSSSAVQSPPQVPAFGRTSHHVFHGDQQEANSRGSAMPPLELTKTRVVNLCSRVSRDTRFSCCTVQRLIIHFIELLYCSAQVVHGVFKRLLPFDLVENRFQFRELVGQRNVFVRNLAQNVNFTLDCCIASFKGITLSTSVNAMALQPLHRRKQNFSLFPQGNKFRQCEAFFFTCTKIAFDVRERDKFVVHLPSLVKFLFDKFQLLLKIQIV